MTKDEVLAFLPEMSIEELSTIKHEINKLMYEHNKTGLDEILANPPKALKNLETLQLPREIKDAMEMNKEAIMAAYGVMRSLGLITEIENDPSHKPKD